MKRGSPGQETAHDASARATRPISHISDNVGRSRRANMGRGAVKIVDDRGIESLKVLEVES